MAWNPSPEVAVARDAARSLGHIHQTQVTQAVVLYVTADGKLGYASYGHTAARCRDARLLADKLYQRAVEHFEDYAP